MGPDTIVGYTYKAENLCPQCISVLVVPAVWREPYYNHMAVEEKLDIVAKSKGIDRYDETMFDSDEFPKVVFADMLEDGERCGYCNVRLS